LSSTRQANHHCVHHAGNSAGPPPNRVFERHKVRLYTAIARHTVLVMAALAICAITAALLKPGTDAQAPPPVRPGQPPPADPGMIPLTVAEIARLLSHPSPPRHARYWLHWRRRHQALARWYHQRTLWVPKIPSPHATCEYSWIRPPSRSRRRMRRLPSAGAT
jgi:hypothetical protein